MSLCTFVSDGFQASLESQKGLENSEGRFDLVQIVILDHEMPNCNGVNALVEITNNFKRLESQLKDNEAELGRGGFNPDTVGLVRPYFCSFSVHNNESKEFRTKMKKLGFSSIISKPPRLEEIVNTIEKAFQ